MEDQVLSRFGDMALSPMHVLSSDLSPQVFSKQIRDRFQVDKHLQKRMMEMAGKKEEEREEEEDMDSESESTDAYERLLREHRIRPSLRGESIPAPLTCPVTEETPLSWMGVDPESRCSICYRVHPEDELSEITDSTCSSDGESLDLPYNVGYRPDNMRPEAEHYLLAHGSSLEESVMARPPEEAIEMGHSGEVYAAADLIGDDRLVLVSYLGAVYVYDLGSWTTDYRKRILWQVRGRTQWFCVFFFFFLDENLEVTDWDGGFSSVPSLSFSLSLFPRICRDGMDD